METLSSILARKPHGQKRLAGYNGGGAKSHAWLSDQTQVACILLLHSKFFPKYAKKMAFSDFTLIAQCFFYIIEADQKLTKKAAFGNARITLAFWTHTGWKWRDARKKYCMQMIAKRIEMAILRLKISTISQNFKDKIRFSEEKFNSSRGYNSINYMCTQHIHTRGN